jgi:hypothetical protein
MRRCGDWEMGTIATKWLNRIAQGSSPGYYGNSMCPERAPERDLRPSRCAVFRPHADTPKRTHADTPLLALGF